MFLFFYDLSFYICTYKEGFLLKYSVPSTIVHWLFHWSAVIQNWFEKSPKSLCLHCKLIDFTWRSDLFTLLIKWFQTVQYFWYETIITTPPPPRHNLMSPWNPFLPVFYVHSHYIVYTMYISKTSFKFMYGGFTERTEACSGTVLNTRVFKYQNPTLSVIVSTLVCPILSSCFR